jgi:hypothetical protein
MMIIFPGEINGWVHFPNFNTTLFDFLALCLVKSVVLSMRQWII